MPRVQLIRGLARTIELPTSPPTAGRQCHGFHAPRVGLPVPNSYPRHWTLTDARPRPSCSRTRASTASFRAGAKVVDGPPGATMRRRGVIGHALTRLLGWTAPRHRVPRLGCQKPTRDRPDERKRIVIDTSKHALALHGVDGQGRPALRREPKRGQVETFSSKPEPAEVVLEACGGSPHWGRVLSRPGHRVRLIPAQHTSSPSSGGPRTTASTPKRSAERRRGRPCPRPRSNPLTSRPAPWSPSAARCWWRSAHPGGQRPARPCRGARRRRRQGHRPGQGAAGQAGGRGGGPRGCPGDACADGRTHRSPQGYRIWHWRLKAGVVA